MGEQGRDAEHCCDDHAGPGGLVHLEPQGEQEQGDQQEVPANGQEAGGEPLLGAVLRKVDPPMVWRIGVICRSGPLSPAARRFIEVAIPTASIRGVQR